MPAGRGCPLRGGTWEEFGGAGATDGLRLNFLSTRLSQATVDLMGVEEKRMIARIRREEALSLGTLTRKGEPAFG